MKDLGFASIPAVLQYLRYAEHHDINTQEIISKVGIDPLVLKNQDGRIKGELFHSLIKELIYASGDPLMGLNTSKFVEPGSYSVQGYMMMSCASLNDVIKRIPPFEKLVGDMGVTSIHPQREGTKIQWHCAYPDPNVRLQMIDNVLSSWVNYAQWLASQHQSADYILLEHPKPHQSVIDKYQDFYQCPIEFNANESSIVIPKELLSMPLRQPNKSLLSTLEDQAENQISKLNELRRRFSIRITQSIRIQLKTGVSSKELIAAELNMTTRTLQRKLAKEDSSYQALLDQIRLQMASDMLLNTQLGIQDIAYNLGFSDGRSFHRSFKSWTNITPGVFRKEKTH